ncbi:MAG: hypothetical protein ACR2PR_00915 [Pseudohongiellaceae bacterium]
MHLSSKQNKILAPVFAAGVLALFASTLVFAQAGRDIRRENPQLAALFNAFDVTHASAYDEIAAILANPSTTEARNELAMHFRMMQNMSMSDMMSNMNMGMSMDMPYGDLEIAARVRLLESMREQHSDNDAAGAWADSDAINRRTARVLRHGRAFENRLFAIYVDGDISDKQAAVAEAVADYLEDDRNAVASSPKDSSYLLSHPQGTAFQTSFPGLSGFLWTQQWLQLAALEAVILEHLDENFAGGVATALERFWNKIGSDGGMSMFPAPVELPMAPTIAPNLYSQSPEAAIILDNLNVLETLIADTLAYPNMNNREDRIDELVADFTNKAENLDDSMNYLLFALRGGIYNQGGPAVGELMQSERNRSRAMMDMQHSMIMSTP